MKKYFKIKNPDIIKINQVEANLLETWIDMLIADPDSNPTEDIKKLNDITSFVHWGADKVISFSPYEYVIQKGHFDHRLDNAIRRYNELCNDTVYVIQDDTPPIIFLKIRGTGEREDVQITLEDITNQTYGLYNTYAVKHKGKIKDFPTTISLLEYLNNL